MTTTAERTIRPARPERPERNALSTPGIAEWSGISPRIQLQASARDNRRRHAARRTLRLGTLLLLDSVGLIVAMLVVVAIHPSAGWGHVVRWNDPAAGVLSVLAQNVVAVIAGLFLTNAYVQDDAVRAPARVTFGVALGLLVLHWDMLWHDGSSLLTSYVPHLVAYAALVWLSRRVGEGSLRALVPSASEPARALFVGSLDEIEAAVRRSPRTGPHAIVRVAGLDPSHVRRNSDGRTRTLESQLQAAIHEHGVDTTVLCSQFTDEELSQLVVTSEAAGCRVISVSRIFDVARQRPAVRSYGGDTLLVELTQPGIRGRDVVLKRVFDLVTASVLLLLLAPLLLVVALLVTISSPGPALFRQERVGYRGRRFHILKFRTIRTRASSSSWTTRA
jgi:Bacterial sugar transferase